MKKKVSIIVPVYHVELYLKECVDSILSQTYKNFELILVDDGGDDECPQICDSYAAKDPRVKCIHKSNQGQAYARRTGVWNASGEYFMFVDADDWLEEETLEQCLKTAENEKADVVMFAYKRVYPNKIFNTSLFADDACFLSDDIAMLQRRMIGLVGKELSKVEEADRLTPMWGKLYSRKAVAAGKWYSERETGSSEDALFNLYAFSVCEKCCYINKFMYCYRKTNAEATTQKYRNNLVPQWEILFQHFQDYIEQYHLGGEFQSALQNRIALGILGIGLNELSSPRSFLGKAGYMREILSRERWRSAMKQLDFDGLTFKWKVFYTLCVLRLTELLLIMLWMISRLKSKVEK